MSQNKKTYLCELSGETWKPSKVKLLPFDRDNWYANGEIETRPPTTHHTLFGLEENKASNTETLDAGRWLPIKELGGEK